jgi:hypothetical protein
MSLEANTSDEGTLKSGGVRIPAAITVNLHDSNGVAPQMATLAVYGE